MLGQTASYFREEDYKILTGSNIISCDHMHTMERAIKTKSSLGFMLRDLDNEFCSRLIMNFY
jgi:hypothetical protein